MELRGVFVPLVTPFDAGGGVDLGALERLCHECLDDGAAGIVAFGTTGEPATLDAAERAAVLGVCESVCRERSAPLVVAAGTNDTRASAEQVAELRNHDAVVATLVVTPYYVRPSQEGLVQHFLAVAAASPVPVIVYNIPYRTGREVSPSSMLRLAAAPNVAGVKQALDGIDAGTIEVLAARPARFHLFAGDDLFLFPLVALGGAGGITASAHVCTRQFVAMVEAGLAGAMEEGWHLAGALVPVVKALFAEPSPAVLKGVLHAQGRIATPALRLPMTPASQQAVAAAMAAIEAVPGSAVATKTRAREPR